MTWIGVIRTGVVQQDRPGNDPFMIQKTVDQVKLSNASLINYWELNNQLIIKSGTLPLERKGLDLRVSYGFIRSELEALMHRRDILHPQEKKYLDQLRIDRRKHGYLLGRLAAKTAIGLLVNEPDLSRINIEWGVFNFPVVQYFTDRNVQVSISHSGDYGTALAFFEIHPVAVDIEVIEAGKESTLRSQLNERELELLNKIGMHNLAGLTMCWTIKEALSKVIRTGLAADLKIYELSSIDPFGKEYLSEFKNFAQYKVISKINTDYACSIVIPKKTVVAGQNGLIF